MKSYRSRGLILILAITLMSSAVAEARIGGGRSSGSRGARGFGSRTTYPVTQPPSYQRPSSGSQAQPFQGQQAYDPGRPVSQGASGGFMKGLAGGMAGGFLGSMLFRGMGGNGGGWGGGAQGSGGGIGLLELLLLAGIGYFVYRQWAQRTAYAEAPLPVLEPAFPRHESTESGAPPESGREEVAQGEVSAAQLLQANDSRFNLARFKDERMDDFLRLQSSWNLRDLSGVSALIAFELKQKLDDDIRQMRNSRQINKIENIAVRSSDLVEAWNSAGQEFATLRFRANLLDYTVDEDSGSLIAGDKSLPVKFEEDWTFVRRAESADPWMLTSIEV